MYLPARFLLLSVLLPGFVALVSGCADDKDEALVASGFVLPQGNTDRGLAVFLEKGCRSCHEIAGLELPPHDGETALEIKLGGKRARIKNYGELLTSVVNPNHVLSSEYRAQLKKAGVISDDSPMPSFNDQLSVTELIDLVQFLHSRYEELVSEYRGYRYTWGVEKHVKR